MPREEHVISVFLASPGDVQKERTEVKEAIEEFNKAWSRDFGIRLDLLQWETHAFPSIGVDAQDVINRQIPDDYDLFVGIMWHRLGKPTERASSGTVEEFERAIARHTRAPLSIDVMFYFKNTNPPADHDPAQLSMVHEFRKQVASHGALYWEFNDLKMFGKRVRVHLAHQVQKSPAYKSLLKTTRNVSQESGGEETLSTNKTPIDHFLRADTTLLSAEYLAAADRLLEVQKKVSHQLQLRQVELRNLTAKANANPRQAHTLNKEFQNVLSRFSLDLQKFAASLNVALSNYAASSEGGINTLIKNLIAFVGAAVNTNTQESSKQFLQRIENWLAVLEKIHNLTNEIRYVVNGLLDLTPELKTAKGEAVHALDRLIVHREFEIVLIEEASQVMQGLIKNY